MNIHPLFVHFPIALLTLYALMEILGPIVSTGLKFLKKGGTELSQFVTSELYKNIKGFLVIVGTLLAFPTLQTGELAERVFRAGSTNLETFASSGVGRLIEMHATFATVSVVVFSILALVYLSTWRRISQLEFVKVFSETMYTPKILIPLSILGILLLTITGALGGAITYGPDVDPVVKMVYSFLF
jgi:uncharacterized membrane protein